jgi:hypothetical protein
MFDEREIRKGQWGVGKQRAMVRKRNKNSKSKYKIKGCQNYKDFFNNFIKFLKNSFFITSHATTLPHGHCMVAAARSLQWSVSQGVY